MDAMSLLQLRAGLGRGILGNQTQAAPAPEAAPSPDAGLPTDPSKRVVSSPFELPGMNSLVGPEGIKAANHRALLALGAGILRGNETHRIGEPGGLGWGFATGIQAANQAFDDTIRQSVSIDAILEARQMKDQRLQMFQGLGITPDMSPDTVRNKMQQAMMQSLARGDQQAATTISEVLKTMKPAASRLQIRTGQRPDGSVGYFGWDPETNVMRPVDGPDAASQGISHVDTGNQLVFFDAAHNIIGTMDKSLTPVGAARDEKAQQRLGIAMAGEYRAETGVISRAANSYNAIQASMPAAFQGDPIAQKTLLIGYLKMIHPEIGVRQGEQMGMSDWATLAGRLGQKYANLFETGQPLPNPLIKSLAEQTENQAAALQKQQQVFIDAYSNRAQAEGLDPSMVVVDYFKNRQQPGIVTPTGNSTTGGAVKLPSIGDYFKGKKK